MNRRFFSGRTIVLLGFLLACSVGVSAQQGEGAAIAVVDLQRAVLQTEKAQAKLEELKKQDDFKSNMESIEGLEKEYQAMVNAYKTDRAVMSAEKRAEEEKRIIDKQNDLKYIASKLQQAQQAWAEQMVDELGSSTKTVLKNLVREQKIGVLLRADTGVLLHADDSYDITVQVTERLNQIK